MTVFNKNNVDFRKNKIFFGEELKHRDLMSSNILYLTNLLKDSWVSFGDLKKFLYKKIGQIIKHSTMHKNISLHLISDIKHF